MLGVSLVRRGRGGLIAGIRNAVVPVSAAGGRAMSVWSGMPMGPPDPILGLTGERRRSETCMEYNSSMEHNICNGTMARYLYINTVKTLNSTQPPALVILASILGAPCRLGPLQRSRETGLKRGSPRWYRPFAVQRH